jgi:UDP-N-acetyl-2-amino-2-deoxyglucuronate dehydrogenase
MTKVFYGHAIIGCGRVSPNHADGFSQLPDWELRWACDTRREAAEKLAAEYGIAHVTGLYEEVLADPDVTSVSIAVDHASHASLAMKALEAGKHLLVEKPLALSAAEAERAAALAHDRGLVLSTVSQHRYDPLVDAVREWINDGLLGRLLYAHVSLDAHRAADYYRDSYWRGTWQGEGGSALINQGYHCLDVAALLLGGLETRAATARPGGLGNAVETEDTLSALLHAGQTPLTLQVTVASSTTWRSRIDIVGTRGAVSFDLDHPSTLHRSEGNPELLHRAELQRRRSADEAAPGIDYYGTSHRRQIADFAQAATTGAAMRFAPDPGIAMARVLEEIYATTAARPTI